MSDASHFPASSSTPASSSVTATAAPSPRGAVHAQRWCRPQSPVRYSVLPSGARHPSPHSTVTGDPPAFAAARAAAAETLCPGAADLLQTPNNILGIEYCKAILEQEAPMTPVPLPRVGAGHGQALAESGHAQFASASALRVLWAEQGADALAPYVPEKALELYKKEEINGTYTDYTAAGRCQLTLLRAACAAIRCGGQRLRR